MWLYVTYDHIMHDGIWCIFSVLCGTYLIDQFGCKKVILLGDTLLILCSIIIGFYNKKRRSISTTVVNPFSNYMDCNPEPNLNRNRPRISVSFIIYIPV